MAPLNNEWGIELWGYLLIITFSAAAVLRGRVREACSRDRSFISHRESVPPRHSGSWLRWIKRLFLLDCTSLKGATSQETESNFPSVISRVFDLRQIREWKKNNNKSRKACEKAEAFRRTFFTLGWPPATLKGGFLQRQRRWHHPFSSQLRFIENIQENAARLLSSQLACQTQTNTPITGVPAKRGNPFLAVRAYNRNLVRCNDLQCDKWSQNRHGTLNGT